MVFREGRTKAIGTITKIHPYIPGSGLAISSSTGACASKKKPSQVPKVASTGSVGRPPKGRRGRNSKGRGVHAQVSAEAIDHRTQ